MKTFRLLVLGSLLLSGTAQAASYFLDKDHTSVGFAVKHLVISTVKGSFNKFSGTFDYDPTKKTLSNLNVEIDTDSITTGNKDRDDHLRSNDFLNAPKFPKITFKGEKVEFAADGKTGKITGPLTIRDKTKTVTLDVVNNGEADFMGTKKIGFSATTKISRGEFGVSWNKTLDKGGVAVGDEVTVTIDGEANMKADAPAKEAGGKKDEAKKDNKTKK